METFKRQKGALWGYWSAGAANQAPSTALCLKEKHVFLYSNPSCLSICTPSSLFINSSYAAPSIPFKRWLRVHVFGAKVDRVSPLSKRFVNKGHGRLFEDV